MRIAAKYPWHAWMPALMAAGLVHAGEVRAADSSYLPLEGSKPERPQYSDQVDRYQGTRREDFFAAMTARDLKLAKLRWELFLAAHRPGNGPKEGYEDAPHIRLVREGEYELVRIYYLSGDAKAGDALLREIKRHDSQFQSLYPASADGTGSSSEEKPASEATPYQPLDDLVALALNYKGLHADEFNAAARSKDLGEAHSRWEAFLKSRKPGSSADPSQATYVRQAQYELVRIYFLLHKQKEADALLKEMKHTDALFEQFYNNHPKE